MSVRALGRAALARSLGSRRVAGRADPRRRRGPAAGAPAPPAVDGAASDDGDAKSLAGHVATFIPGEIIALYLPIAGGIAATPAAIPVALRLWIAVGLGVLTAIFIISVAFDGWRRLEHAERPPARDLARSTAFPALGGGIAAFVWASVVPESWISFEAVPWAPVPIVALTAIVLAIIQRFIAPLPRTEED